MSRKKISDVKVEAIVKMKELGFTVVKISELLKVSRLTVYDHLHPDKYADRLKRSKDYQRRTMICTGASKEGTTVIKHLEKRPYTEVCELCETRSKRLHYHHWISDNPSIGVWVCFNCHRVAELIDEKGASEVSKIVSRYYLLKFKLAKVQAVSETTSLQK